MLELILCGAALAGALWLAISAVDMIVAIIRREWKFSIRGALMLTAAISLTLGAFAALIRK
jgi:hypothetical protein